MNKIFKKITFSTLLFLILSAQVEGQTINKYDSIVTFKSYLGMSFGIFNDFNTAIIDEKKFIKSNKFLSLGLIYTKPLNKNIELSFEENLNIYGDVYNNYMSGGKNFSYNYPTVIINFPIIFRYILNKSKSDSWIPHFIELGPAFNFDLGSEKAANFVSENYQTRPIENFMKPFSTSLRVGTGYTFDLKYAFIRTELIYSYGFSSFKRNTLPFGIMTEVKNDALGLNIIFENRNIFLRKKINKLNR